MSTSIKVIKFTSILSAVFLVTTYLITVNIENSFISLNTIWISNNFLLTVFGGVFASTLVVLFCEINKYYIDKKNTENQLFYQALYLYQALFLMWHNILDYQSHPTEPIPKNIFDNTTQMIKSQVCYLRTVDYSCIKKDNVIEKRLISFKKDTYIKFSSVENGINLIRCAILEEIIDNRIQDRNNPYYITSSNARVAKVLSKQMGNLAPLLEGIGEFLKIIDDNCNNRYNWNKISEMTQNSYISLFSINKETAAPEGTADKNTIQSFPTSPSQSAPRS